MGLVFRGCLSAVLAGVALSAAAADTACRPLSELRADIIPPVTSRIALDCIRKEQFDDAVAVYLAYNSYSLFDRMRVKDLGAHVVAAEMDDYLLSGLSLDQIAGVRGALERLRDTELPLRGAVCGALRRLGPPDYRPNYMIWRSETPLKSEDDWIVPGFDATAAWERALVEFNQCPPL